MSCFSAFEAIVNKSRQSEARKIWIDVEPSGPGTILTVTDDSPGVSPEGLLSTISPTSCSSTPSVYRRSCLQIGHRALVFSKHRSNQVCSVGLLSEDASTVPMCRWVDGEESPQDYGTLVNNLQTIMGRCPFEEPAQLLQQAGRIAGSGGRLVLFELLPEMDLSVPGDILIKANQDSKGEECSLSQYLSVSYLNCDVAIYLRNKLIRPQNIACGLHMPKFAIYRPQDRQGAPLKDGIKCIFGINTRDRTQQGVNVYEHGGRLAKRWLPLDKIHLNCPGQDYLGITVVAMDSFDVLAVSRSGSHDAQDGSDVCDGPVLRKLLCWLPNKIKEYLKACMAEEDEETPLCFWRKLGFMQPHQRTSPALSNSPNSWVWGEDLMDLPQLKPEGEGLMDMPLLKPVAASSQNTACMRFMRQDSGWSIDELAARLSDLEKRVPWPAVDPSEWTDEDRQALHRVNDAKSIAHVMMRLEGAILSEAQHHQWRATDRLKWQKDLQKSLSLEDLAERLEELSGCFDLTKDLTTLCTLKPRRAKQAAAAVIKTQASNPAPIKEAKPTQSKDSGLEKPNQTQRSRPAPAAPKPTKAIKNSKKRKSAYIEDSGSGSPRAGPAHSNGGTAATVSMDSYVKEKQARERVQAQLAASLQREERLLERCRVAERDLASSLETRSSLQAEIQTLKHKLKAQSALAPDQAAASSNHHDAVQPPPPSPSPLCKVKVKQLGGLPFFREVTLETMSLGELRKRIASKFKCEVGAIKSICVLSNDDSQSKSSSIQSDAEVQQHCSTGVKLTFLKNSDTGSFLKSSDTATIPQIPGPDPAAPMLS